MKSGPLWLAMKSMHAGYVNAESLLLKIFLCDEWSSILMGLREIK